MDLIFFGTPAPAVPFLEAACRGHRVKAVVTQPDRPSGRGLVPAPPPVKAAALRLGLPVLQPENPSGAASKLKELSADMAVVVAYGRLLRPDVLAAARLGFLNAHFSLLPKYRGAAPVQWSLIKGELRTGVTYFWLDEGLDTGPVQGGVPFDIPPDMDARGLLEALTGLGARGLEAALADISAGRVRREPQQGPASAAPKLSRALAAADFDRPAVELRNLVRGLAAGPRAFLALERPGGKALEVVLARTSLGDADAGAAAGTVLRVEPSRGVLVQCRSGTIWVEEVQPQGKQLIKASDFLNGLRLGPGDKLEVLRGYGPAA